jgi:hypothetical protein
MVCNFIALKILLSAIMMFLAVSSFNMSTGFNPKEIFDKKFREL